MNDRSYVLSAGKPLRDSMIGSGTRGCIPVKRNSSVAVTSPGVDSGDVVGDSLVQMLWVVISVPKLVGSVSSRCWMKSLKSGSAR